VPQDATPLSVHTARRSGFPAAIIEHLPGEPARLQERQPPVQTLSQQTPSTHCFDVHSLAAPQTCPSGLRPQVLFTQAVPVSQSLSVTHELVQAPLAHWKG
jgi:hypothetical protein